MTSKSSVFGMCVPDAAPDPAVRPGIRHMPNTLDLLVIGGGNAALCAALMAREAGLSVLMLEAAPREWRAATRSTRETCAVCMISRRTCW